MQARKLAYSIIIPVYNNSLTLKQLYKEIDDFFKNSQPELIEIIFVDDCSSDDSWLVLEKLRDADSRIGLIRLKNNIGQHQATLLGLLNSNAPQRITLDADLQTPPSEIKKLIDKAQEGYHVVIGPYEKKKHGIIQNLGSEIINKMLSIFFAKPRYLQITSFKL